MESYSFEKMFNFIALTFLVCISARLVTANSDYPYNDNTYNGFMGMYPIKNVNNI